ncbi:MAG: type II toxin-antitoxin system RelE/ParE family toxin [Betaproteobacteria bacterium]|nr:MAG: type II toxin-antitoxin system RelE/ParE family toxin [Betaproteobacteria bacterium]
MRIVVRPAAAADIDEAFLWYEGQRPGLGHEFLATAQTLINAVAQHPLRYPVVRRDTRRALLRRFPYTVYFRIYDEVVVVVACMHGRRNPRRWQVRT